MKRRDREMFIQIVTFNEDTKTQIKIECELEELKDALKSIKKIDKKLKKI
jgi:hypothetical protein